MRDNVRAFVKLAAEAFELDGPVYEFGSYLVEGQEELADLRPLFPNQYYVGCDLRPGPGVDRIEDLAALSLADGVAQTIVCVETLEHVFEARRAVDEMIRVLAPGGVILIAAPLDFHIHDHPSDYWRLTPSCLTRLLAPLDAALVGWQGNERFPHTVFALGAKRPVSARFVRGANQFVAAMQQWVALAAADERWQRRLKRWAAQWLTSKSEHVRRRDYFQVQFVLDMPRGADWKHELLQGAGEGSGFRVQGSGRAS
ncbi:MAG TPA: methyltransferase domain-containing protein [Pirellulales bacterium]|nr:methyltransferase domain-containing protein [Pirellulales bacterium]